MTDTSKLTFCLKILFSAIHWQESQWRVDSWFEKWVDAMMAKEIARVQNFIAAATGGQYKPVDLDNIYEQCERFDQLLKSLPPTPPGILSDAKWYMDYLISRDASPHEPTSEPRFNWDGFACRRQYEVVATKFHSGWVSAVPALASKRRKALRHACVAVALVLIDEMNKKNPWNILVHYHAWSRDLFYLASCLDRGYQGSSVREELSTVGKLRARNRS